MALTFNGSNTSVNLATGLDLASTRPLTVAALVRPTSSSNWNCVISQGQFSGSTGWEFSTSYQATGKIVFAWFAASGGGVNNTISNIIPTLSRWHMIAVSVVDAGSSTSIHFYDYDYQAGTLTKETITGLTDSDIKTPGGSTFPSIGRAWNAAFDPFNGQISWVHVESGDLSEGGATNPSAIWELIVRGGWGRLDGGTNVKLFMPFSMSGTAQDFSGLGRNGTLTNSPVYFGGGPVGEMPPFFISRPQYNVSTSIVNGGATLTGQGTLTANGVRKVYGSASLTGATALQATGVVRKYSSTTLQGTGTLTANGVSRKYGAASLNSVGSLSANAVAKRFGSAVLSGVGSLSTSGVTKRFGAASLSGAGSLAVNGVRKVYASSALNGAGSLTAVGVTKVYASATTLSGSGSLAANAVIRKFSSAALTVQGNLVVTAVRRVYASALLQGIGFLQVNTSGIRYGAAALTGQSVLNASASVRKFGSVALTANAQLTAQGVSRIYAQATLTATGQLTVTGIRRVYVSVTLAGVATLTASATGGAGLDQGVPVLTLLTESRPVATLLTEARPTLTLLSDGPVVEATILTTAMPTATVLDEARPTLTILDD